MKRTTNRLVVLALATLAFTGCSGSPPLTALPPAPPASSAPAIAASSAAGWTPAPDASFRQNAPEPTALAPWTAPLPTEHRLSNGIRVLIVERSQLPITVVQVTSRRGADQQRIPGLGAFAGRMIEQGTKTRSALQVSDDYESIGAQHGAWVTWDSTNAWVKVLPQELDKGLTILADVVQNPAFADDEIERARSQQLAAWRQMRDMPQALLSLAMTKTLYPNHPYGSLQLGDEASIKRIKRQDIASFYDNAMVPSDTAIIVVGKVSTTDLLTKLEGAFGAWKRPARPAMPVRKPAPLARSIVLVDMLGAAQSNLAVAGIGIDRAAKDYDAMEVANTILGGMFSSRLNLNLREKHSYTYGARSYVDPRHGVGPFAARAAVDTPNTGPALREMINELQAFCTAPAKPDEINLALGQLIKSMPGDFEGAAATASQIADLWIYGLPLDTFRTQADRLGRVSAEDIQRVAATHMALSSMTMVVVGDRKVVQPQLEELRFGPIRIVDKDGKVVETVAGKGGYVGYACQVPAAAKAPAPPPKTTPPAKPPAKTTPPAKPAH